MINKYPCLTLMLVLLWPWSSLQAAPAIQDWETSNGARVLFVEAPDLPMVDVRVVFDAGSARDGDQLGLASITARLLTDGAGDWDADTLAERLEAVGASVSASVDRDMASVAGRSLTDPSAYQIWKETMAAVLSQPTFAEADLARLRENRLVGLRRDQQRPGTIAQRALYRQIFGDHPYAEDSVGTIESVAALTREDLVAFHERYYVAANAVVAIVGALDREQADALAERLTSGLPSGTRPPPLPPVPALQEGRFEALDFPSSQTHVMIGQPGMRRGDPDYYPLHVGNHILGGGGLVSLLAEEIREKRGLAYSIYSAFVPLAELGPFVMGLQTRADQADQARKLVLDTVERFLVEGPSEQELEAAIKNITGGFPLRTASNRQIVEYLAVIGFYRLPLDHLDRFAERVASVTGAQIQDAFARRIDPDRLAIIKVGPVPAAPSEPLAWADD